MSEYKSTVCGRPVGYPVAECTREYGHEGDHWHSQTHIDMAAHGREVAERAWDEAYQAGAYDTLRSPRDARENPYRAGSLPDPAALPCHQGVRGCTEVGEHYHPDEKYANDAAPEVSVSGEQVEAAWAVLNAHGLASGLRTGGRLERDVVRDALTAALGIPVSDGRQ